MYPSVFGRTGTINLTYISECVVQENIHTPTQRELEIPEGCRGGGGVNGPGNSRGEEG